MRRLLMGVLAAGLLMTANTERAPVSAAAMQGQEVSQLDKFFMDPAIIDVSLSPNGKELLVVRNLTKEGPRAASVYKTDDLGAKPQVFGSDGKLEFRDARWADNGYIFLEFRDIERRGERTQVRRATAIANTKGGRGAIKQLGDKETRIFFFSSLPNKRGKLLVTKFELTRNGRPKGSGTIHEFDLKKNKIGKLVYRQNERISVGRRQDYDGDIRLASEFDRADVAFITYARLDGSKEWKKIHVQQAKDKESFRVVGFVENEPNKLWVVGNFGQDKQGVHIYDLETDTVSERMYGKKNFDAAAPLLANDGRLLAHRYQGSRTKIVAVDKEFSELQASLNATFKGQTAEVVSVDDDGKKFVVRVVSEQSPRAFYLYEVDKGAQFIGSTLPFIKPEDTSPRRFIKYQTRDGHKNYAYVTIPSKGEKPYPTIVMPHGGPWARDRGDWHDWAQYLSSMGYMVIEPQYRGSTGFGIEHQRVADGKWGLMMQDDIDDSAFWAIEKGLADPDRMVIKGYSFGGYAALVGSFREGGPWQCAISGAPVAVMQTWQNVTNGSRFGRQRQKAALDGLSPVKHTNEVRMPLLVMHGASDFNNSARDHSRPFVAAMKSSNKWYKYVELEGMGHQINFWSYDNAITYWTEVTNFLNNDCWADHNRPTKVASN